MSSLRRTIVAVSLVLALEAALPLHPDVVHRALASAPRQIGGHVPGVVASHKASLIRHHDPQDQISLVIGLPLRSIDALNQFLKAAGTPGSPAYHHYLNQAQANQAFGPTVDQEKAVRSWAVGHGLSVAHTYPNHLLVDVRGSVALIEAALQITINDYSVHIRGKQVTFYSTDSDPQVDASVANDIVGIVGLSDIPDIRDFSNGQTHGVPYYFPQDLADAYDVNSIWSQGANGTGQHIGIVLSDNPPSDQTLQTFAYNTGLTSVPTRSNGKLQIIKAACYSTPAWCTTSTDTTEAAIDVEYASALAPGATIDYYEAPYSTSSGTYSADQGTIDADNLAGTDPVNNWQISNSWGICEGDLTITPTLVTNANNVFAFNSSTGHNYFFGSGDSGAYCQDSENRAYLKPYFPASSPYVTAVGGTSFAGSVNGAYPGEWGWWQTYYSGAVLGPFGSSGGYSSTPGAGSTLANARPAWQTAYSQIPSGGTRAVPDVAAVADPATGGYLCQDTGSGTGSPPGTVCTAQGQGPVGTGNPVAGGTSLATPLWAGVMADVNSYLNLRGQLEAGFINPTLYGIAAQPGTYAAFHDVTANQPTNGAQNYYGARAGWDEVTGLGTPDVANLAAAMASGRSSGALYAPSGQPGLWHPGDTASFTVTVTNNGTTTWYAQMTNGINATRLGIELTYSGGGYPSSGNDSGGWPAWQRFTLPSNVAPGQSVQIPVSFQVPTTLPSGNYLPNGSYVLEYQMVQEGVGWFPQYLDSAVSVDTKEQILAFPNSTKDANGNILIPMGSTTIGISWDTGSSISGDVRVSVNGQSPQLVATAPHGSGTIPWIVPGNLYTFSLYINGVQQPGQSVTVSQQKSFRLTASPDPIPPTGGQGSTTITWDTGNGSTGCVGVSSDGSTLNTFAVAASGSGTAPWITPGVAYTFYLYSGSVCPSTVAGATALASVVVHVGVSTAVPSVSASPNPVVGSNSTVLSWDTSDGSTGQVYVSANGGPSSLCTQGPSGSGTIPWIYPGNTYIFTLYAGTAKTTVLASVTVTHS